VPPADKAVVILGNGGNWFKFQNPLDITQADIDQKRQWVLDLVFNPEGLVKGFSGDGSTRGNIREQSEAGGLSHPDDSAQRGRSLTAVAGAGLTVARAVRRRAVEFLTPA